MKTKKNKINLSDTDIEKMVSITQKNNKENNDNLFRWYYCTQNNGNCKSCSLSNYSKDCKNNKILEP